MSSCAFLLQNQSHIYVSDYEEFRILERVATHHTLLAVSSSESSFGMVFLNSNQRLRTVTRGGILLCYYLVNFIKYIELLVVELP
jgi:hypothetical protein